METPNIEPPIVFADVSELDRLVELIHDEYFDTETLQYDSELGMLKIPFARCFHYRASEICRKTILGSVVYKVPVLRCCLIIRNILECQLPDDTGVGFNYFNFIRYDADTSMLTVENCFHPHYSIRVSSFSIEYIEEQFRGHAKIKQGFWGDSSPRFLKD